MLVLARKRGEEIIIFTPNGEIRVKLLEVRGNIARLGFDCGPEISVWRKEKIDEVDSANERKPPSGC